MSRPISETGAAPGWATSRGEYAVCTMSNWKRTFSIRKIRRLGLQMIVGGRITTTATQRDTSTTSKLHPPVLA